MIQHVIEYGGDSDKNKVVAALTGKICSLSQHKFARCRSLTANNYIMLFCKLHSNVVEKFLAFGSDADKKTIIAEISHERQAATP